jgi:hypothetical protein
MSAVAFTLRGVQTANKRSPPTQFSPRLGQLVVTRPGSGIDDDSSKGICVEINTPGFLTNTSRGVVPHLSRDHVLETSAIRGVHITYDSLSVQYAGNRLHAD